MLIKQLNLQLTESTSLIIDHLALAQGESLLVVGDNASGKSLLAQILAGRIKEYKGEVSLPENIAYLSFELEADTLAHDRHFDNSEQIEGGIDWGRNALQIITEDAVINEHELAELITLLNIEPLLNKPFKILSTGETRKILMAQALAKKPNLLILDEPYAGLDIASQHHLTMVINSLIKQGISIILFDFYHEQLPKNINNLVYLVRGKIAIAGDRFKVTATEQWRQLNAHNYSLPHHLPDCINYDHIDKNTPLVDIKNVSVTFEQRTIFSNLSWQFNLGQHWQIIGPNGCGKSTLLAMICGDSPKAYGKDIWLFGKKRGTGESIWDIKKHYGLVSAQLHRDYRVSTTLLETVLSGFFDSIGLYDRPSRYQINIAKEWLTLLGLDDKAQCYFSELSYGEQRLALITRAVVKLPLILILDEPCQGLDNQNRAKVLALVDFIASRSNTHILFVSHDIRDKLSCLTHQLTFTKTADSYHATSTTISY